MVKPLSEQLSDLSVHAKKAEDDVSAAKKETHDKVVARRAQLHASATQSAEKLKAEVTSASGAVSNSVSVFPRRGCFSDRHVDRLSQGDARHVGLDAGERLL